MLPGLLGEVLVSVGVSEPVRMAPSAIVTSDPNRVPSYDFLAAVATFPCDDNIGIPDHVVTQLNNKISNIPAYLLYYTVVV